MCHIPLTQTPADDSILTEDLKSAHEIGSVCLGSKFLFFKKLLKTQYIAYSEIYRAFRRVKSVDMKLCCGKGELQLEYFVVCNKKEEIAEFPLPDNKSAEMFLAEFQAKSPETKIGVKK
ncbi:MAG: hypothetical protein KBT11_08180 [Treponema sp.]|nr:hypothetical protein [Candidatus Treponema equifaecale]